MAKVTRPPELPLVGKWATRLGRVVDIWGMPCNPTPDIWVTAAWRTIPRMLIMTIKPSAAENIHSRFGKPHGRTPKWKLSSNAEVKGIAKPTPGTFSSALFKLSGKGLVFLQYVQFIDIATAGLLQWSSLTYTYAGCAIPGGGGGEQSSTEPNVQLGSLSGSILTMATNVSHQEFCAGFAFAWACSAEKAWSASYGVNWEPVEAFPNNSVTFELQDGAGNVVGEGFTSPRNEDGTYDSAGFFRVGSFGIGPKNFVVVYRADFTFKINSAHFSVAGSMGADMLKPDP